MARSARNASGEFDCDAGTAVTNWAIVIAVPIGFWAMNDWLHHFVYHVELSAWTFVLAAVAALVIAWGTVTYQSYIVARAKPASALRYE